ncbi:MAG: DUF6884 domain-containing protein [Candidatus Asgardarchaeia archaeon]
MRRIAVVTACGRGKKNYPTKAYKLYKSSRIKAVYNLKNNTDMYILSAKYGLIHAEEVIEPYDEVMTEDKAIQLTPSVAEKLKGYDFVIFFKAGARKEYLNCIHQACKLANVNLIAFGYGNMGDVRKLPDLITIANTLPPESIADKVNELCKNPIVIINKR